MPSGPTGTGLQARWTAKMWGSLWLYGVSGCRAWGVSGSDGLGEFRVYGVLKLGAYRDSGLRSLRFTEFWV